MSKYMEHNYNNNNNNYIVSLINLYINNFILLKHCYSSFIFEQDISADISL